jgi:hypothetical protein
MVTPIEGWQTRDFTLARAVAARARAWIGIKVLQQASQSRRVLEAPPALPGRRT